MKLCASEKGVVFPKTWRKEEATPKGGSRMQVVDGMISTFVDDNIKLKGQVGKVLRQTT